MVPNDPAVELAGKSLRGQHVLIIEGFRQLAHLLADYLETEGYCVTYAPDGAIGLTLMGATLHPLVVVIGNTADMRADEILRAIAADQTLAPYAIGLIATNAEVVSTLPAQFPALIRWAMKAPFALDDFLANIAEATVALRGHA